MMLLSAPWRRRTSARWRATPPWCAGAGAAGGHRRWWAPAL